MDLTKKISFPLLCSLLIVILFPYYFPSLPLVFFAPYLCFLLSSDKPLKTVILCAFFLGLFIDLVSSHLVFGSFALSYVLTSMVMYRIRNLFFSSKAIPFALMVSVFSLVFFIFDALFNVLERPLFSLTLHHLLLLALQNLFLHFFYGYLWMALPSLKQKGRKELQSLIQAIKIGKKLGLKKWLRPKSS